MDDVVKKYTDIVTGYKYTFTFDGAEDVLSEAAHEKTVAVPSCHGMMTG